MKAKDSQAGCKATGIKIVSMIYIIDSERESWYHMGAAIKGHWCNNASSGKKVPFSFRHRSVSCQVIQVEKIGTVPAL